MWSLTDGYSLGSIGERPLGNYTEIQRQVELFYRLAQQLEKNGQVYAQVDPESETYKLGQGDESAAMLYGLKPYMVMQPLGTPTPLVKQPMQMPQLGGHMQPQFLRSLLHKIVEES